MWSNFLYNAPFLLNLGFFLPHANIHYSIYLSIYKDDMKDLE